ncbi:hypothetical protein [Glutamicibacter endophyticus]|uniref:hypothetical protein n=1 Tax=Glutamicibacter endophyticus TaxID=1522174 RepID=UPI003AF1A310
MSDVCRSDRKEPRIVAMGPEKNAVRIIQDFLSGAMGDEAFLEELYGQSLDTLRDWPNAPAYVAHRDLLQYLLLIDLGTPAGRVDAVGVLEQYLCDQGVYVHSTELGREAAADYELLMSAQPTWVDIDALSAATLLEAVSAVPERSRRTQLQALIKQRYRYVSTPPRWLQAPTWPVVEQYPTVFVGQLDITDLHHDTAYLYVFVDEASGAVSTVTQQL